MHFTGRIMSIYTVYPYIQDEQHKNRHERKKQRKKNHLRN